MQVTITLSDGSTHTGTLDSEGALMLPRGKKPAEPWWSRSHAAWHGNGEEPLPMSGVEWTTLCTTWYWASKDWFRIRPIPSHTWESLAAEAGMQTPKPSTPPEGIGGMGGEVGAFAPRLRVHPSPIRPLIEDVDYIVAGGGGGQSLAKPARDYTDWQEGMGAEAKPEDYSPEKYEVEFRAKHGEWISDPSPFDGGWGPEVPIRVRLRQQPAQPSQPSDTGLVALWNEPGTTAVVELPVVRRDGQPESDEEFMRRVLRMVVCETVQSLESGGAAICRTKVSLTHDESIRLASLIGGAK